MNQYTVNAVASTTFASSIDRDFDERSMSTAIKKFENLKLKTSTACENPARTEYSKPTSTCDNDRTKTFAFLRLPGEIRNQILRLALTHQTPIICHSFSMFRPPSPVMLKLAPNILGTWKKIHNEGRSILYGENTFQAHHMLLTGMVFALDSRFPLSPACVPHVRRFHIRVRADADPFYHPSQVETAFNNAEVLEVEVFRSSFEVGDDAALHCFFGVRGVKIAKVHGSIREGFARWIERCMMSEDCDDNATLDPQRFNFSGRNSFDVAAR